MGTRDRTRSSGRDAAGRVAARPLVELFGRRLLAPILVAPVGAAGLVRRHADVLIGGAAARAGVPYVLSNQGSSPMEAMAAAMGESARWFQLYWGKDEQPVDSPIGRAEAMGTEALVVTLDTTMVGWRPQDLDLGSLAAGAGSGGDAKVTLAAVRAFASMAREAPGRFVDNLRSPFPRAAVETFLDIYSKPSLSWSDIATLSGRTRLPVLLKGILHPDDAVRAVELGIAGVIVSNHGGPQVDGAVASLDALVDVVAAVDGRVPVLLDSGVRTGADVVKALALGATAVLVGRPCIYGLALAGQTGVQEVLENLVAELDLTMGLSGLSSVAEAGLGVLRRV